PAPLAAVAFTHLASPLSDCLSQGRPRERACEGIGFAARILLAAGYGANTGPFSSRAGTPAHGSTHYLVCCLSTDPRGGPIRRLWSATDAPPSGCWQAHATRPPPEP